MRSVSRFLASLLLSSLYHASEAAYLSESGQYTPCLPPCTDYGIVITPRVKPHTLSMSVYKFSLRKGKELEPSDVKKVKTTPSEVPIDFNKVFSKNVSIATSIVQLVRAADKAIPRDHHLSSPIFFSTNERINALNPAAWFKILGEVNLLFANKTVPFLAGPLSVYENKAETEALFKWLLVNFLSRTFTTSSLNKTVGVLSFNSRMGSEISYEKEIVDKSVTGLSTIKGISHAVVTSDFFKRGESYPLREYFKVISSPRKTVVESPCVPKGVKKRFKGLSGAKWIVGTGDVTKCRNIIRRHLLSICDKINGCAYLKQPFKGKIIGYPDVGETMGWLGYDDCVEHLTPAKLDAATRRVCGRNRTSAKKRALANQDTKREKRGSHVFLDCISGNFLYLMLTEAYKMRRNTGIQVKKEIAGLEVDTSLGELLVKMGLLV